MSIRWIYTAGLLCSAWPAWSQTTDEWLRQKETARRYLTESIVQLRAVAGSVQEGYRITREGLAAVHRIKEGDFSLHRDYITSLSRVSSPVRSYDKVAAAAGLVARIRDLHYRHLLAVRRSRQFTADEEAYQQRVYVVLLRQSTHLLQSLLTVLQDGTLEMKEAHRLARIDAVHAQLEGHYHFARQFYAGSLRLALQRQRLRGGR